MEFIVIQEKKTIKLCTYRYLPIKNPEKPVALVVFFCGLNAHMGNNAHLA